MAGSNGALTWEQRKELVAQGRMDAYAAVDLLDTDGDIDKAKLRRMITDVLVKNEVADGGEKATKAFHQGTLTAAIFPNQPGAKDTDQPDEIQLVVWNQLRRDVWSEVNPDAGSHVQQSVGASKEGALLVKTTKQDGILVQGTVTPAAYVTTDDDLLLQDFEQPLRDSVRRATERLSRNMLMLGKRKPEIAARVRQDALDTIETAQTSVRSVVGVLAPGKKAGKKPSDDE